MATSGFPSSYFNPATMDPFEFDSYLLQRMNEMFGQDFQNFFSPITTNIGGPWTTRVPATIRREREEAPFAYLTEALGDVGLEPEVPALSRRERRYLKQHFPVDIVETDEGYVVEAALPGVEKENIDVHIDHNNVLTINARPTPFIAHKCGLTISPSSSSTSTSAGAERGGQETRQESKEEQRPQQVTQQQQTRPQETPTPASTPQQSPTKEKEEGPQAQQKQEDYKFLLSERTKGRLHRSMRLPKNANAEGVKSCMENGILCLLFNKLSPADTSRKIEI